MADILRGPWPRPAAALPAEGFADGARVRDQVTGARGTVRGAIWGDQPIGQGRPLKYAVEWDDPRMIEAVVACRLIPLRPMLAPREAGQPGLTTLHARRISRAPWWPGKGQSADGGDDPKGAA